MDRGVLTENLTEILLSSGIDPDIKDEQDLVAVGVSSIQLMKVAAKLRKAGYKVTFADLISQPTFGAWKTFLKGRREQERTATYITHDMHEPFPMTDVQNAYWIGRMGGQNIGNVGCHGYMEVDVQDIDPDRLDQAFYELQLHHPMLRVVITEEGMQYISDKPYREHIERYDYRQKDSTQHLQNMRDNLSHRLLDIYHGQVICLQLTLLPGNKARLHYDIDLLIADVTSFQIILRDLVWLYNGKKLPKESAEFNFGEYILNNAKINQEQKKSDKAYWGKRLPTLAGKPELPVTAKEIQNPSFERREAFLEPELWSRLKEICAAYRVTPAIVLLTLYAKVIARFATNTRFLINLPLFNREGNSRGAEDAVADFTTLTLIEYEAVAGKSFIEEVEAVAAAFREGMNHVHYSGVAVERKYLKLHPEETIVAPIVYSCNIGVPLVDVEFRETFGDISYMISQTPQVWLDFQLFDNRDGLLMIWDSVKGIFEGTVLDEMFKIYQTELTALVKDGDWTKGKTIDIQHQIHKREQYICEEEYSSYRNLQEGFFENVTKAPDAIALIDVDGSVVSYQELAEIAHGYKGALLQVGVQKGECVGICFPRGKEQIGAVLGTLAAGAAYVTIGVKQPEQRRRSIVSQAKIQWVLADVEEKRSLSDFCKVLTREEAGAVVKDAHVEIVDERQLAYIIFTSGSTGEPKGVMISHKAAQNTIADINSKFNVSQSDCALQVSQLDFDLSVYDIFGVLGAGGRLVLVPQGKETDASVLLQLICEQKVTIYNSVPALLELMLIEAEAVGATSGVLRLALISGDWIPLDLPERFAVFSSGGQFISLGGATEGAIWSNYYPVTLPLPSHFKSIPYGYPLKNQRYRVVNDQMEDCPDYVAGELLIGGAGVAEGYVRNEQETQAHFVMDQGIRWYKTGDYGRFIEDGMIEFLGRRDHQIKIRGHRIETEEIEAGLLKFDGVSQAVVIPVGEKKKEYLVGFVVPEKTARQCEDSMVLGQLRQQEQEKELKLPDEAALKVLTARYMLQTLKGLGVVIEKGQLVDWSGVQPILQYQGMIELWGRYLQSMGYIEADATGTLIGSFDTEEVQVAQSEALVAYEAFADRFLEHSKELIRGDKSYVELFLENSNFNLQDFIGAQAGASEKIDFLVKAAQLLAEEVSRQGEEAEVLILGARATVADRALFVALASQNNQITIADTSLAFLNDVKEMIKRGGVSDTVTVVQMTEDGQLSGAADRKYDLIISADFLHQLNHVPKLLTQIRKQLHQGGILLFSEVTENSAIQLVTTAYLEEGFGHFTDGRQETGKPLYEEKAWARMLKEAGFVHMEAYAPVKNIERQAVFVAKTMQTELSEGALIDHIRGLVPSYMVPKQMIVLPEIPYTGNGKVDRKALCGYLSRKQKEEEKNLPISEMGQKLAKIWQKLLLKEQIYLEDDFYMLGGDSLLATKLKTQCRKELGVEIRLEDIFQNPVFGEFVKAMEERKTAIEGAEDFGRMIADPKNRFEPFPLTEVQKAYWIGRNGGYDLGEVSSHCYFEMEGRRLEVGELERSWNTLVKVHDMMRAVILADGSGQRIKKTVPYYKIKTTEVETEEQMEAAILSSREEMAGKVYDSSKWPLFDVRVTYSGDRMCVHTSFDNIVYDGFSIFHLLEQWKSLTDGKKIDICKEISFRDYVQKELSLKETAKYQADLHYWEEKAKQMAPAPQLPKARVQIEQAFQRFQMILGSEAWEKIEGVAKKHQLTLPVIFIGAYAEILGRYSNSRRFTINLTRFQKYPFHEEVEKLIGDFTTLSLLEVDLSKGDSFVERCQAIGRQLHEDMEHSYVSGVEVERMLSRRSGSSGITMPIVFTSGFGVNRQAAYFGEIVYGQSQTPQVWLDQQISIQNGKLHLSWDAIPGIFAPRLIENMFEEYQRLFEEIGEMEQAEKAISNLVRPRRIAEIEQMNNQQGTYRKQGLLEEFYRICKVYPDQVAVWSMGQTYTYCELDALTDQVAAGLLASGLSHGEPVAVMMEKSPSQIVAVVAILRAGGYYVPIDKQNPKERIAAILAHARVTWVLTDEEETSQNPLGNAYRWVSWKTLAEAGKQSAREGVREDRAEEIGYIIFTSGSTGDPKGVVITQEAAMNTILDVNARYGVTKQDGTIMLSNLNFDLSVYDIFGMLNVGGRIVIPDYDKIKNPDHWERLIVEGGVTIWNSVPTFMQMLLENDRHTMSDTIRLVLLSGDWIPTELPEQIYKKFGTVRLIALGGATEASIWSNFFEVPKCVPADWESIPYGRPLSNQGFLILGEDGCRVPVGVAGELHITGKSVANGYINDEVRTKSAFIRVPGIEGAVYKTGDYGKYTEDGTIIFMGRKDTQIKRGGHRIELGEIERKLGEIDGIRQSVVTFEKGNDRSLAAHVLLDTDQNPRISRVLSGERLAVSDLWMPLSTSELQGWETYHKRIHEVAVEAIFHDLKTWGIFDALNTPKSAKDLLQLIGGETDVFEVLMEHLLQIMAEEGVLEKQANVYRRSELFEQRAKEHMTDYVGEIGALKQRLWIAQKLRLKLLKGQIDTKALYEVRQKEFLYPDELTEYQKETELFTDIIKKLLTRVLDKKQMGTVYELASRTDNHTSSYMEVVKGQLPYVYLDESLVMLERKKAQLPELQVCVFRPDREGEQDPQEGKGTIILAENTLHRCADLDAAMRRLKRLLMPGGILVLVENTRNQPLMYETVAYLEEGYRGYVDFRKETNQPLLSGSEWVALGKKHGFAEIFRYLSEEEERCTGKNVIVFSQAIQIHQLDEAYLRTELKKKVPEYMMPNCFLVYESFPISANGKIDRKMLTHNVGEIRNQEDYEEPVTKTEIAITAIWKKILGCERIGRNMTFFELGGDSLSAIRFINMYTDSKISLQMLTAYPLLKDLAAAVDMTEGAEEENEEVWEEEEEII